MTYSNLSGRQITLVQNEYEMLMWRFLLKIFLNGLTACSQGVMSVEDVQNNV